MVYVLISYVGYLYQTENWDLVSYDRHVVILHSAQKNDFSRSLYVLITA
jgi:hypothetical protein